MPAMGNKYYHMSDEGAILGGVPEPPKSEFKQGMKYMALIGGSCFMLACVAATITTSVNPSMLRTSDVDHATNLVSLSGVSRLPSVGAVKPASMQSMRAPMVLGSGPFRKIATSPTEVSNLQNMRDIKVFHGDDWGDMPADLRAKEAQRVLGGLDLNYNDKPGEAKPAGEVAEAAMEEEEIEQPKDMAFLIGFMFLSLVGLGATTLLPQTFN